jgi:hypothetical protein
LRQVGVAEPPVGLQQAEHFQADSIEFSGHGRIFHFFVKCSNLIAQVKPTSGHSTLISR